MIDFTPNVYQNKIDDELVLMDTEKGEYFGINKTGTLLLELLLEHQDKEKTIQIAVTKFSVSEDIIRKDLDELLETLLSKELIHIDEK